jgi:hypothetical protein
MTAFLRAKGKAMFFVSLARQCLSIRFSSGVKVALRACEFAETRVSQPIEAREEPVPPEDERNNAVERKRDETGCIDG